MNSARALDFVGLSPLMEMTSGRPEIRVGLIDGPVTVNHQGLNALNIHEVNPNSPI